MTDAEKVPVPFSALAGNRRPMPDADEAVKKNIRQEAASSATAGAGRRSRFRRPGQESEPRNGVEARYMTLREAAAYLSLTEKALRRRVERRQIPFTRIGRSVRFDRRALDRLMQREAVDGTGLDVRVSRSVQQPCAIAQE